MTDAQRAALTAILEDEATTITEFHHGDCIGADAEAYLAAMQGSGSVKMLWGERR